MKTLCTMIILWLLAALVSGCVTTEYTLYLQDVSVTGPVSQPPVHITNKAREKPLRIIPHVAINAGGKRTVTGKLEGHSMVDRNGVYQVDTVANSNSVSFHERSGANAFSFMGKNLRWNLPDAIIGADIDYALSDRLAISFGASYSSVEGKGLWGYMVGLGILSEDSTSAFRVDGGLRWQTLAYDAHTAVVVKTTGLFSSNMDEVGFYRDTGTSTPMNFFASLTFNTKGRERSVYFFAQLGISRQSLARFKPEAPDPLAFVLFPMLAPQILVHDARADFSSTVFSITPGVYLDINPSTRVVAGVHFNFQTEIEDSSPGTVVLPLLQLEKSL